MKTKRQQQQKHHVKMRTISIGWLCFTIHIFPMLENGACTCNSTQLLCGLYRLLIPL